jgi:hypothetical protein
MTPSKQKGSEPGPRRARWFGSVRILSDGRMRFSQWSYTDLPHVSLNVTGTITVLYAGMTVMYIYPERNRIVSACFSALLTPDQLRMAVAALRRARHGLDSWVVPALEFNYGWGSVREDPEMSQTILELLASCRDLPVAKRWKKVRAVYFTNQGSTPPEIPAKGSPQRKTSSVTPSRKAPPQGG